MREIKVYLSIGYPGAAREDVLEFEDDATEEEIDGIVQEWANDFISIGWREG